LEKRLQIKGIGNGISCLWLDLARLPQALFKSLQQELQSIMVVRCCWLKLSFVISYHLLCTIGYGVRKIPVQYARRTTSGDFEQDMLGGNRQWIPLKLNFWSYANHFAQAIMFIPAALAGLSKSDTSQSIVGAFSNMFVRVLV
jgi:preprotein translocase subunit SecY